MPNTKTILHVEDKGADRRTFMMEVVPDDCFRVVHLNPAEEVLVIEEAVRRISKKKDELDFVVVDLAMSEDQHRKFDIFFDEGSLPADPQDEDVIGGLGLIHSLITELKFDPDKIAILTQHLPTGGAFRDVNQVSRVWWNASIPTFYKSEASDFRELRKLICDECGISFEQENSNDRFAPESVFCVSDVPWFRKQIETGITTYNDENTDGKNIGINVFSNADEATEFFKSKKKGDQCLYIVDISANDKENESLKSACDAGSDEMAQVLGDLRGVTLLNHISLRDDNASFIVVSNCGHQPGLVRWFMRRFDGKVKFVLDMKDFKMNLVSALWSFMNSK